MTDRGPDAWLQPLPLPDGQALPGRLLPGPMEGVSEGSFLDVMTERGLVQAWHTPFLRISTGVPRRARLAAWLAPYLATGRPVIAQIMGTDSARLAAAARRLHDAGAIGVDLNCACPSPTVVGNQAGGYRLRDPDWIARTLDAMRQTCGIRAISVKIRCGFESPAELPAIAAALRRAAPDLVFCHFRTVREMYRPVADGLERLRRLRDLLPDARLFGAGDLFTVEDAFRMGETTQVDGVTPARGLIRNPGLLREIAAALGGPAFTPLTSEDKISFLHDLSERSGLPVRKRGFVIHVARAMGIGFSFPGHAPATPEEDSAETPEPSPEPGQSPLPPAP